MMILQKRQMNVWRPASEKAAAFRTHLLIPMFFLSFACIILFIRCMFCIIPKVMTDMHFVLSLSLEFRVLGLKFDVLSISRNK